MINIKKMLELAEYKLKLITKTGKIKEKNFKERKQENKQKFIDSVLQELEENHNHTWYEEIYERNKNNLNDIAIFYRGTNITYGEMFEKMKSYAKSLKELGATKGTEIPICMSNTPELVYLLGAISMIGAKANIFNSEFASDYITEIIDGCNSKFMFVEDGLYDKIQGSIADSHISDIFMTSLTDSLPKTGNPYEKYDAKHGHFKNTVAEHKSINPNIRDIREFEKIGTKYTGELLSDAGLDDEFTTTYSSGSTNSNRAKAIVHNTRSFITIGRCHDTDVQKTTSMKNFTIQAQIPTHSNTDIISSISDSLMQGSKVALEPIYDGDFFIDSLLINKPTYVVATRSFWIQTMKKVLYDPHYKNVKMPYLLIPFSVGEPLEPGEEKFLNKGLRKVGAGKDFIPSPISPVTMSVAGGDCEHGGIFWILYRALQSKKPTHLLKKEVSGLNPFEMVEVAVLDEEGKRCQPYQLGRLVANSPCNMKEYKNNPEATAKFFIQDAEGKTWGDCNVYSYIDSIGGIHMKGRIPSNKEEFPSFLLADAILKDTKNLMSCEIVRDEENDLYIAHIEMQPGKKQLAKSLLSADQRCERNFGTNIVSRLVYRVHTFDESYELTGCGKRNHQALEKEGVTEKCIKPIITESGIKLQQVSSYLREKPKIYTK